MNIHASVLLDAVGCGNAHSANEKAATIGKRPAGSCLWNSLSGIVERYPSVWPERTSTLVIFLNSTASCRQRGRSRSDCCASLSSAGALCTGDASSSPVASTMAERRCKRPGTRAADSAPPKSERSVHTSSGICCLGGGAVFFRPGIGAQVDAADCAALRARPSSGSQQSTSCGCKLATRTMVAGSSLSRNSTRSAAHPTWP
mmetsp:Transcript_91502/g.172340  ORF Transcript_91502/g.172340 Transcript_91502/m.172340 type:complete len:202 (+) Transcript_91502:185-790(+)